MSKITQKLRSRRGASLILAMVFMLMCLFVGGSVLAAAAANGGRVAEMTSTQQTYLSQRSAALLMADLLEGEGNTPLQLTIKFVTVKDVGDEKPDSITVTYSLPKLPVNVDSYCNLQRILVENAVQKYRNALKSTLSNSQSFTEKYVSFCFPGVTSYGTGTDVLYTCAIGDEVFTGSFQMSVTAQKSAADPVENVESLTARFTSPVPNPVIELTDDVFDMTFDFGEDSVLSLYVNATYSEGTPVEVRKDGKITTTTTTVILWDDPVIEKGGLHLEADSPETE